MKSDMKASNEMMERREAERKVYDEKMMAKWEAVFMTDVKKSFLKPAFCIFSIQ
jgi:hypothetical protein